jgi:hypothetical protein
MVLSLFFVKGIVGFWFLGPHDLHIASRLFFFPPAEAWFETETTRLCVMSAHFFCLAGRKAADIGALRSECPLFSCFCGWLSGGLLCYLWGHMRSSSGDCPLEGRA